MSISNKESMMIVIFVEDQKRARDFYKKVLDIEPFMDVPGVTEFKLAENMLLGIMPNEGIAGMLKGKADNLDKPAAFPKCEIYLSVDNPDAYYARLIKAGGLGVIEGKITPWGGYVAYGMDIDGNLLAFAR